MEFILTLNEIYERRIHNSLSSYAETILSNFISAYKKSYGSNHVLLRLTKNCKKSRDNKNFVGTVLWISPKLLTVLLMI